MSKMFRVDWVKDRRPEVAALARAALVAGLEDITEDCLGEANTTIPHEEGIMQDSGFAEVDEAALEGQVAYDTPYTVVQHEDPDLRHDEGRRDHWLSETVEENRRRYEAHLAAEAARRLR